MKKDYSNVRTCFHKDEIEFEPSQLHKGNSHMQVAMNID